MTRYSYPAIFTPEENGAFSIRFPDLESCYTCGDNLTDGIMMAEDVLAFTLYDYEQTSRKFHRPPHPILSLLQTENSSITLPVTHCFIEKNIIRKQSKRRLPYRNGLMKLPFPWILIFPRYCRKHFYKK